MADLYYIESGYFDPEYGYFVYTADAGAAISASATLTAQITVVGVPIEASADLATAFTQSSIINVNASAISTQSAEFTQTTVVNRIQEGAIALTGAFTPTLTVDVFKNSASVIECVATITADTVATRVFNITLESIVTQSLQSQRLAGLISNQSAQFSFSASADNRTQEGTASLSTTATISATANKLKLVSASLTSAFTQTTLATDLADRPLIAQAPAGTLSFDTSIKQFGSASLYSDPGTAAWWAGNNVQLTTDQMFLSGWYRPSTTGISAGSDTRISTSPGVWRLDLDGALDKLEFKISADGTNYTTVATSSSALIANTWYHIAVSKNGTSYAIWINGNRVATGSYFSTPYVGSNTPQIWIGNSRGHYDEWEMQTGTYGQYNPASSTYTVPTQESANTDNTEFLFHFNGNYTDDTTGQLAAAITSAVTVTADASRTRLGAGALSTAVTVTANAIRAIEASADLQVQGFTVTTAGRIQSDVADLDSQFTLTANAGLLKVSSATLTTAVTLTATALDVDLASAALTSQVTVTATARRTRRVAAALTSAITLSCQATRLDSYNYYNIRSLLHFNNNLLDEVTATNVTASSISYVSGQTNFSQAAIPSVVSINRTTGDGITTIGTSDFSYDVKLKARTYQLSLQSGVIARFVDAVNKDSFGGDIYYDLEYRTPDASNITVRLIKRSQVSSNESTLLGSANIAKATDSNDIVYRVWSHVKLLRKNGQLYIYVDGTSIGNVAFSENLTSSITLATDNGWVEGGSPFYGKLDESCLRIDNIDSTANFTPQTVPYGKYWLGYAEYRSTTALTIDYKVLVEFSATLSSQVTQTTLGQRVRYGTSTLTAQATQTTQATKIVKALAQLSSQFTQVTNSSRARDNLTTLSAAFAQTANNIRLRNNSVELQVTATQTAQAKKFVGVTSTQTSEFTQTVINDRIRYASTQFESIATELTAAVKNATGLVLMESQADLTAVVRVVTDTPVVMSAEVTVTAEPRTLVDAEADITAQASMNTDATKFRPSEANLTASVVQVTHATIIARTPAVLTSEFTLSVNPTRVLQYASNQQARATQTAQGDRYRQGQAQLQSQAQITAIITNTVRFIVNLQVNGFVLSAGRIVHIDPYTTYMIPQESRHLLISEETRLYTINQETRVNIIKGSTL